MIQTTIRRAGPEDAAALAEVGRDTFVETFAHLYPPEDLAGFLAEAYAPEAFARYLGPPEHALWLAEQGGRAVGYVQAGPCALPYPEVTPRCGEVKRLYVRKETQGSGLGTRLLAAALEWLGAPGRRLWIGVWSQNLGAQRLYARHGFERVGAYQFPVGNTLDDEFILSRTCA
ncbi:MAG TPA: GNAT family N-acetyltransferase [Caulobacteraceae bacterium]|jgi:GNAT superfamily N-acetyltransferase|nr:GNAT family N-acetyltransferase [Caulobacteraceae bacterium]